MTLTLRFAARSDRGLIREGNEDSLYAGPRLLAVADGMGGHAGGEVASAVAIASLAPLDGDGGGPDEGAAHNGAPGPDLLAALEGATLAANELLREMVNQDAALDGMGTTLTAILSAGVQLGLVHVGDSRAYLYRDGELHQITRDHTLVQTLVDEGRISVEEAGAHPQRNIITRALDGRQGIELDLTVREGRPGDRFLLCTDGLSGVVSDATLALTLAVPDAQEAVDSLIDLALRGGAPDNVTAIVADVVDTTDADEVTDLPVVAGAAADGLAGAGTRPDSPAVRAADVEGRGDPAELPGTGSGQPGAAGGSPGRRPGRRLGLVLLAVGVAGALVALGGWQYLRSQYYVGTDDSVVAIFRGVSGSVVGVPLSRVHSRAAFSMDGLPPFEQQLVQEGIPATSLRDAEEIVGRLRNESAGCASASPTPSSSPEPAPTPETGAPTEAPTDLIGPAPACPAATP